MIEDYLPTREGYDRKQPVPLSEQHEACPSWWGLKGGNGTVCCALCLRDLGPRGEPANDQEGL